MPERDLFDEDLHGAGDACGDDSDEGHDAGDAQREGPSMGTAHCPPEPTAGLPLPSAPLVALFDAQQIDAYEAVYRRRVKDQEERAQVEHVISHLRRSGVHRTLHAVRPTWRQELDEMQQRFPNGAEYIDYLRTAFVLAEREGNPLHLPPVLLNGPPGVGKTLLAGSVAELIGSSSYTVNFSSQQENSSICGSSAFWSNAKPGQLFTALVYGSRADPVIVLDEIDKANADRYDPLGPLYHLLERDSAARFHDQCHEWLTICATWVVFIATSNDPTMLPAPIRSRLRQIEIPPPTPEQAIAIVRHLWQDLCTEMPAATQGIRLMGDAIDTLAAHPPRLIRRALREAVGRALYAGRTLIGIHELRACLGQAPGSRRCGFV